MRVGLSDDFFKTERSQTYSDWRLSTWRELFQNAIDQGATRINVGLKQADACVLLTFADNGPGMSRETLEKVYFAIGATTKGNSNQIGGMGRARILTCFAMQSYQIRSHDYLVFGSGGEYHIEDAPFVSGCALTIAVDDATLEQMQERFDQFLGESRIDARIFLNDTLVNRRSGLLGRYVRDLSVDSEVFGRVHVNKSTASHRVIVRVNGVAMYTTRTSAKAQIIVELEPSLSRQVLTSNRDGMHLCYRDVLDSFLRELAVDTTSSLRSRFTRRTTMIDGGGMRTIRKSKPIPMNAVPSQPAAQSFVEPVHNIIVPDDDSFTEAPVQKNDFNTWLADTFGDIYVFDETSDPKMHKVVANYLPENWRQRTVSGRTFRAGGTFMRILLLWQTAVAYALEVALEPFQLDDVSYAVGFLFADDRSAEHRAQDDGHVFSFCPVTKGKLAYAVNDRKSLKRLMSLAKHEVTHVAESWHGESFASQREEIDMRFDEAECFRRMRSILRTIPTLDDM